MDVADLKLSGETTVGPRVLVVEDEVRLMRFLCAALAAHGYRIVTAATGKQALAEATLHPPELILLDLGLPDMDGLAIIREIREWTATPIIVISARGNEASKIQALDAGADDFLAKPFGIGELLARMRAGLRHAARLGSDGESALVCGEIRIDLLARQVTRAGEEVRLTPTEYRLLTTLAKHAGKVLTHRQLLLEVRGPGGSANSQYLRVYMAALRRKLERDPARPRYIVTEAGVGYRMRSE